MLLAFSFVDAWAAPPPTHVTVFVSVPGAPAPVELCMAPPASPPAEVVITVAEGGVVTGLSWRSGGPADHRIDGLLFAFADRRWALAPGNHEVTVGPSLPPGQDLAAVEWAGPPCAARTGEPHRVVQPPIVDQPFPGFLRGCVAGACRT